MNRTTTADLWVCHYCHAECVDYPTLEEHQLNRCKVLRAIRRRRTLIREPFADDLFASTVPRKQKVLEDWGLQ